MLAATTAAYPAIEQRQPPHKSSSYLTLLCVTHSTLSLHPNEAYHGDKALHTAAKDSRVSSLAKRYPLPFAIVLPPHPHSPPTPPPTASLCVAHWQLQLAAWQHLAANQVRNVSATVVAQQKKYEIILRIRLRRAINNFTAVYGHASASQIKPNSIHTNKPAPVSKSRSIRRKDTQQFLFKLVCKSSS